MEPRSGNHAPVAGPATVLAAGGNAEAAGFQGSRAAVMEMRTGVRPDSLNLPGWHCQPELQQSRVVTLGRVKTEARR